MVAIPIRASSVLLLAALAVAAPHPQPVELDSRGLGGLLVKFGPKILGKLKSFVKPLFKGVETTVNVASIGVATGDVVSAVVKAGSGSSNSSAANATTSAKTTTARSVDIAFLLKRQENDIEADDTAEADDTTDAEDDDVPTCSIDSAQMASAANDALSKTQSLLALSSDADFQSAVDSFNATLQPIFDGIDLLNVGDEVGAVFEPTPDMAAQFESFIQDAQTSLEAVTAPSEEATSQIQSIGQDLSTANSVATANCGSA